MRAAQGLQRLHGSLALPKVCQQHRAVPACLQVLGTPPDDLVQAVEGLRHTTLFSAPPPARHP